MIRIGFGIVLMYLQREADHEQINRLEGWVRVRVNKIGWIEEV